MRFWTSIFDILNHFLPVVNSWIYLKITTLNNNNIIIIMFRQYWNQFSYNFIKSFVIFRGYNINQHYRNKSDWFLRTTSKKQIMSQFIHRTTCSEKEQIDLQMAKYISATNTPFSAVQNSEFKKLVQLLRPGYNPPSRFDIGAKLLDKVCLLYTSPSPRD